MNTQSTTFIGVGAIGLPMAIRASTIGAVTVVDSSQDRRRLAEKSGMKAVAEASDAPPAEVSIVMVATASQAEQVILGTGGLASNSNAGSIIVLMSTIGPEAVRGIAARMPTDGPDFVDAPVTGGVSGAANGALTIFASGRSGVIKRVRPLLEVMGRVVRAGGEPGDGQSFKLVNQLLATSQLVVAAEAIVFAERLGLDIREVFEGVRAGAGQSWMLDTYGPRILDAPDDVSATVGIFHKDSTLVSQTAANTGFEGPILASAQAVFARASELGVAGEDASAIVGVLRQMQAKPSDVPDSESIVDQRE